jgi:hypothetical protein
MPPVRAITAAVATLAMGLSAAAWAADGPRPAEAATKDANAALLKDVLELTHSEFLGDQRGILGFDRLTSVGAGLELDSSAYDVIITRTRLVGRYVFGTNVSGFSVGLAVSF